MPVGCCKDIDSMLARLWWGSNDELRKIHWMSWERLSKAKNDGGMSFRGMKEFNKALLGKHFCRLATRESSFLEKIFKSRYHLNGDFMNAKEGYQPSFAWMRILSARVTVNLGGFRRIEEGRSVRIWMEKWQPNKKQISSRSPTCSLSDDAFVSELIDMDTRQWKRDLIFMCFDREDAQKSLAFLYPLGSQWILLFGIGRNTVCTLFALLIISFVTKKLGSN
ncbi:hypothetical protein QL285_087327 [Trifolium repens]|nr:hypothetical protein QL285_087327 [Trifolium repens]